MKINFSSPNTFTSKIKFVPSDEFDEKYGIDFNFDQRVYKDPKVLEEAVSEGIFMCVAGGLTANNKVHMWHFFPYTIVLNPDDKMQKFSKLNKQLGSEKQNGLVVGGGHGVENSTEVFKILVRKFKEMNMDFDKNISIFWHGLKAGRSSHIAYNGIKDTWYISSGDFPKDVSFSEKLNYIKTKYEHRYVCETDEVFIQDEPVARDLINSGDTFEKACNGIA